MRDLGCVMQCSRQFGCCVVEVLCCVYWFVFYPGHLTHNVLFLLGFSLILLLVLQVWSGFLLSSYFVPDSWRAFESILNNSLDVSCVYPTFVVFLHIHQNGSMYFIFVMLVHQFRAVIYGSARRNYLLWLSGFSLLNVSLVVCFLGYVLPFGQMSYWAAIVIVNVISIIPYVGANALNYIFCDESLVIARFFIWHWMSALVILCLVVVHVLILHSSCSLDPLFSYLFFVIVSSSYYYCLFFPQLFMKDISIAQQLL